MLIVYTMEISSLSWIFFKIIKEYDKDHGLQLGGKIQGIVLLLSLAGAVVVMLQKLPAVQGILTSVLFAYLITAGISDWQTKLVHDFLHVICFCTGILLLLHNSPEWTIIGDYMIFLAVQLLIFQRMYGKADVFAFLVCSLYQAACHKSMMTYILHMGATYLLLSVIQLCKRNVNKKGNLKEPVALIPYIAATAWLFF